MRPRGEGHARSFKIRIMTSSWIKGEGYSRSSSEEPANMIASHSRNTCVILARVRARAREVGNPMTKWVNGEGGTYTLLGLCSGGYGYGEGGTYTLICEKD